jgi:RNA-binding protein
MAVTMNMPSVLNGKQRRYLRALAHDKKPVVQLGKEGLTPSVIGAIDAGLETHELIKVKAVSGFDDDLEEVGQRIEQETRSTLCNVVGRTLLLYRRRAKNPKIVIPKAAGKTAGKPAPKPKKADPDDDE